MPPDDNTTSPTLVLTDIQQCRLAIGPKDAAGNPAQVQGAAWASSDTSVCTVEQAEDGLSALVKTVGPVGSCQVTVTADADLGDGVTEIVGIMQVNIIASQATTVGITAGEPEPRA